MSDTADNDWTRTPEQVALQAAAVDLAIGEIVAVGNGMLTRVHIAQLCAGTNCWIHNPSTHHMNSWPIRWHADKKTAERQCAHGSGHPDPDDVAYHFRAGRNVSVHDCDGCCGQRSRDDLVQDADKGSSSEMFSAGMTKWNWMMIEFAPGSNLGEPLIGDGELSREAAHEAIQTALDQTPSVSMSNVWRAGAKDDTVTFDRFVFTIYSHEAGRSYEAAVEWLDDFAVRSRAARKTSG